MSPRSSLLLLPVLSGCIFDYKLVDLDAISAATDVPVCVTLDEGAGSDRIWPGDVSASGYCFLSDSDLLLNPIEPGSQRMTSVVAADPFGSLEPDVGTDARFEQLTPGNSSSDDTNPLSDVVTTSGSSPWSVAVTSSDLGTLDSCFPNCTYVPILDLKTTEIQGDANCDLLAPVDLCFEWEIVNARRRASSSSTCSAGSGRFVLVPVHKANANNDGYISASFKPVQESGTGTLTGAAWITSATTVEGEGNTIRIIKNGSSYSFSSTDDALQNASTVSIALSGTATSITSGVVSGSTSFLVDRASDQTPLDLEVDLTWSCGNLGPGESVTVPQGYQFTSSTFSCATQWPQKLVVRPVWGTGNVVAAYRFEKYGDPQESFTTPAFTQGNVTNKFDFTLYGVHLAGRLVSTSGSGASVSITTASAGLLNVCNTGTFTLPLE